MVETHFSRKETSRLETLPQKIIRHVMTGQFGPQTVGRGVKYLHDYFRSRGVETAKIDLSKKIENFNDAPGVTVTRYNLKREKSSNQEVLENAAYIVEFPDNAKFKALTISETEARRNYTVYGANKSFSDLLQQQQAIAAFIGPTCENEYTFPNNGYFNQRDGVLTPFRDTNPVGQRRGAIAVNSDGEATILEEEAKLQARDANFSGYDTVAGTSFYFKDTDETESLEFLNDLDRSLVSYFVTFVDKNGQKKMGYVGMELQVTRKFIKKLLDLHSRKNGWQSYIAAELELTGGGAFVLSPKTKDAERVGNSTAYFRRDQYLIY